MARKYARGEKAWGICGRGGHRMLLKDMVYDGRFPNMRVDPAWYEAKHPQEIPVRVDDPVALYRPSPEDSGAGYELDLWELNLNTGVLADAGEVLFDADDGSGLTFNVGSQVTFIASACNQALGNAGTVNVSVGAGPVADDIVLLVLHSTSNITLQAEVAGFTRIMNKLANIETIRGDQDDLPQYIAFKKLTGVETNWTHTISGGAAGERFQLCAYVLRGQDLTRPIGSFVVNGQGVAFRNTAELMNLNSETAHVVGGGDFALNDASNAIFCGGSFTANDSATTFVGFPANVMASSQLPNMRVDTIQSPSAATRRKLTWNALVTGLSVPGRTNLLGRSANDFSNAFFTRSGITSISDNQAAQAGTWGNLIESTVNFSTANTQHYIEFTLATLTIGETYTFGVRSNRNGVGSFTVAGAALTVNDGSERGSHFGGVGYYNRPKVSGVIGTGTKQYGASFNTAYGDATDDCYISFVAAATTAVFRFYKTEGSVLSSTLTAGTYIGLNAMFVAVGQVSFNGGYVATSGGVPVATPQTGYAAPLVVTTEPTVATQTCLPTNTKVWALEIRAAGVAVLPMKMARTHMIGPMTSMNASLLSVTGTTTSSGSATNGNTAGLAEGVGGARHPWDTNKKLYFEVTLDAATTGNIFLVYLMETWQPYKFTGASTFYAQGGTISGHAYKKDGNMWRDGTAEGVVGATFTTGDIIGCGCDWTLRQITWYKNGVLQLTQAMPANDRSYIPKVGSGDVSGITFRLHTFTMNFSGSFGGRLPSGFKAWDYDNEVA